MKKCPYAVNKGLKSLSLIIRQEEKHRSSLIKPYVLFRLSDTKQVDSSAENQFYDAGKTYFRDEYQPLKYIHLG
jgi:hypothetical protein